MAYEASEIMFAAALLCKPKAADYADVDSLKEFMIKAKTEVLKNPRKVQFGNKGIVQGFVSLMDENKTDKLADMAGGISAAKAVRRYMGIGDQKEVTSYMTGNILPTEVKKVKVSAFVFADYNSADVMVTADKKTYYGISLKKKRKSQDQSPTLINKAFDTVLTGREFDPVKEKLAKVRMEFFANVIREATTTNRPGTKEPYLILPKGQRLGTDEQLFKMSVNGPSAKKTIPVIDIKGHGILDVNDPMNQSDDRLFLHEGQDFKKTNDINISMRAFVNNKLSDKGSPLWEAFMKVLNDNVSVFSDALLNIILKTKLFKEMDAKDLGKQKFDFALVTGVGNVRGKEVSVGQSDVIGLSTTLCGLTRLDELNKRLGYEIVINEEKSEVSEGAKVFLTLQKGDLPLLDLEIRYKGSFTPQPQFQATLNKKFIDFLKKECDL